MNKRNKKLSDFKLYFYKRDLQHGVFYKKMLKDGGWRSNNIKRG